MPIIFFIEISSYLTDTEQKYMAHFLRHGAIEILFT